MSRRNVLWACAAFLAVLGLCASVVGSAFADDYNPYAKLKKGDWVKYKSVPMANMESHTKQTVTEVTADKVTYEMESTTIMNGSPVGPPYKQPMTVDKNPPKTEPDPKAPQPKQEGEETLTVGGKSVKCKVYVTESEYGGQKMKTRSWVSEDVPFGLVKSETDGPTGKITMELVEFGFGS